MVKKIFITLLILIVAAVGAYLMYSYGKRSAEEALRQEIAQQSAKQESSKTTPEPQAQKTEESAEDRGIPVKVVTVAQEDVQRSQTFYGTVIPFAEANIQGEQGGKIIFLKGKEGDSVKKGELVVQFDGSDTQLEIQRATASKNTAIQTVNQAQSNLDTIQANVKRNEELFKEGFVSQQQLDGLKNQLQVAQASLNTANESVKQADTQISLFNNMLADFKITAPISGIIDEKRYNLSEVYQPGSILYHVINIDKVYIEVEVPESYISQLKENMAVDVYFDSLEGQEFSGKIERIIPKGDPQSRNFIAKALVTNTEKQIKPGMFARIEVGIQSISGAFKLEKKSLFKDGDNFYVFKVVGSQVKKVQVDVKLSEGTTTIVISEDLQSGDRIVTEGTHLLKPDARIKIL